MNFRYTIYNRVSGLYMKTSASGYCYVRIMICSLTCKTVPTNVTART